MTACIAPTILLLNLAIPPILAIVTLRVNEWVNIMTMLKVDFDVYKAITALRESESMTENDVLRQVLGLTKKTEQQSDFEDIKKLVEPLLGSLTVKGVTFPEGTQFRASYKGLIHTATVENGNIIVNGQRCKSPSKAAEAITGNSVNGWKFWECKLPSDNHWIAISSLRKS